MTQQEYVIRRKLNILELAETLGNVSEAARRSGVSRKHIVSRRSSPSGLNKLIS